MPDEKEEPITTPTETPIEDIATSDNVSRETPKDVGNEEVEKLKTERKRLLEERSDMGRRMKEMQDGFLTMKEEMASLRTNRQIEKTDEVDIDNEEMLDPTDPKQYVAFARKAARLEIDSRERERLKQDNEKMAKQQAYDDKLYENLAIQLKDADKEVEAELFAMKFVPSSDPIADAERFYAKAEATVFKRRATSGGKKENPFKGNSSGLATGVGGSSGTHTREVSLPVMSDTVKGLLQKLGKDINNETDRKWASEALAKK